MSETSGAANGKFIQSSQNITPISLPESAQHPPVVEIRLVGEQKSKKSDKLDVVGLYTLYSQRSARHETDVPIALIALKLGEAVERLRNALAEEDELQRENYMSVGLALFFETAVYVGVSPAFDEVFTFLSISVAAHRSSPYSPSEVNALVKALEKMRQNPYPSSEDVGEIYDSLSSSGFDVNAPFADIELGDDAEGDGAEG